MRTLPLLVLFAVLALSGYFAYTLLQVSRAPANAPPVDFALIDRLKEDVQRYLEWVIAIAGIFTIAQTVAAAFAAQSFADQAEKMIAGAKEDVKSAVSEVEKRLNGLFDETSGKLKEFTAKYQQLVSAEEKRKGALEDLRNRVWTRHATEQATPAANNHQALIEGLDWRDGLYESMEITDRQRVLSIDRYLGYDLTLDTADGGTPSVLRLLANFYVSKFEFEKRFGSEQLTDLERAEYLLLCWIEIRPAQFELRNDLGLVYSRLANYFEERARSDRLSDENRAAAQCFQGFYRALSKENFALSLKYRPRQQRALYNLAFIASKYEKNRARAICLLEEARSIPAWEHRRHDAMQGLLLYNLACYRALDAAAKNGEKEKAEELADIVGLIKECAKHGSIPAKVVAEDFAKGGDFFELCEWAKKSAHADAGQTLEQYAPNLSAQRPAPARCITE